MKVYPALVDEGDAVGVKVFDAADVQAEAMRRGTRRLLALTIPSPRAAWSPSCRRARSSR